MKHEYDFTSAKRGVFRHANTRLKLPTVHTQDVWEGPDGALGRFVEAKSRKTLNAYREQPEFVTEHANLEYDTAHGGYAHRQLYELVQNSADALTHPGTGQSILIRLTHRFLYCADDGKPIDEEGVKGLMFAHMSSKRGTHEIGRFGMGFKSVLGVTDTPEFYSRSGAMRFDRASAAEQIQQVLSVERYPALRLPVPIDSNAEAAHDTDLGELMSWATNVVRLPLGADGFDDLETQIREFPAEFLLFVPHVRYLTLEAPDDSREFTLQREGEEIKLHTGEGSSRWRCCQTVHALSDNAREDSRTLEDTGDVQIAWAAPLDGLSEPGRFWAFFPTQTASLLAGILNAPWKTNEDRQNLLSGPYNDELIDAAAEMVARALPALATPDDPARHLDALPRRPEAGDGVHSDRLRESLISVLDGRAVVPDQDGYLRLINEVHYAPQELTPQRGVLQEPLDQWGKYEHRPRHWLHHTALTRNRLARINQLFGDERWLSRVDWSWRTGAPRASIAEWLLALKEEWPSACAVDASKAAVRVAALCASIVRTTPRSLGGIVLTQSGRWRPPDPDALFLPAFAASEDDNGRGDHLVHVELASDEWAARDLRALGIREISAERTFALVVDGLPGRLEDNASDQWWREFWARSRMVDVDVAASKLTGKEHRVRLYTVAGKWQPTDSVLLPGDIVPTDGRRDANVAVNVEYHAADVDLLDKIGVSNRPIEKDLSTEPWFDQFLRDCRSDYRSHELPQNPQEHLLVFKSSTRGGGPLQVLTCLSDVGASTFVDALLFADSSYRYWTMGHETRPEVYPDIQYRSPVLMMLEQYGRIKCASGFADFGDAIGHEPRNPHARRALLAHPMSDRIRQVFAVADPRFETADEEDPIPLLDVWPGAPSSWSAYHLVRCQRIWGDDGSEPCCVRVDSNVLLVGTGTDARDIRLVADELGTELDEEGLEAILRFVPQDEIERRRTHVREQPTDAAKLLCAVGEDALRRRLPLSLLDALEAKGTTLAGVKVAEAALATFHTRALFEYRWSLDELAPPNRWAGSPRAVEFVQSLGFAPEWAGVRGVRRPPFVEVEGPYSLPALHAYQQHIVDRVTALLGNGHDGALRRGMISLPTGAGKTRVAVQAIVQAICDSIYTGGVLWVADRDELCEQAVEAWRQVWSGMGVAATSLRISRMWGQQPAPMAANELHVVVATIQTLHARLSKGNDPAYRFIGDFGLVVFDEAHRSIAPSSTSVMGELGITRWRRHGEPFLLGLTATPYRGHDESETARLVSRYGSNRLDNGAFQSDDPVAVVRELQDMRVLAQADHETIDGGDFSLSKDELAELAAMPRPAWLPRSVEVRIANNTSRTLGIVEAYELHVARKNPDWPTLIFATSVEHAQTVAALLNTKGVKARSVSGDTDRAVRRGVVDDFRAGKINVLVNYGVFREGFDAPKTRAIVVARPVYSPNLYFQMIGRGLRGPKNGGSERCLIINVQDNIDNFNRELAFAELDWLWA